MLVDYLADVCYWLRDSFDFLLECLSGDIIINVICALLCLIIVAIPFIVFRVLIDCVLGG